jgi:hypothetical protein
MGPLYAMRDAGMTKGEMEMLVAGLGEMFEEYLSGASRDDGTDWIDADSYTLGRHVFADFLQWLESGKYSA